MCILHMTSTSELARKSEKNVEEVGLTHFHYHFRQIDLFAMCGMQNYENK